VFLVASVVENKLGGVGNRTCSWSGLDSTRNLAGEVAEAQWGGGESSADLNERRRLSLWPMAATYFCAGGAGPRSPTCKASKAPAKSHDVGVRTWRRAGRCHHKGGPSQAAEATTCKPDTHTIARRKGTAGRGGSDHSPGVVLRGEESGLRHGKNGSLPRISIELLR